MSFIVYFVLTLALSRSIHVTAQHGCPTLNRNAFYCIFSSIEIAESDRHFEAFSQAAQYGNLTINTCYEAAAYLGSIAFNTDNLSSLSTRCDENDASGFSCSRDNDLFCPGECTVHPELGQRYFGRGTMGMKYPCNYKAIAEKLQNPEIFTRPDVIAEDLLSAWVSGNYLWQSTSSDHQDALSCHELAGRGQFGQCLARLNPDECSTAEGLSTQERRVETILRASQCLFSFVDRSTLTCSNATAVKKLGVCPAAGISSGQPDSIVLANSLPFIGQMEGQSRKDRGQLKGSIFEHSGAWDRDIASWAAIIAIFTGGIGLLI